MHVTFVAMSAIFFMTMMYNTMFNGHDYICGLCGHNCVRGFVHNICFKSIGYVIFLWIMADVIFMHYSLY